jgi:hypothetical protein
VTDTTPPIDPQEAGLLLSVRAVARIVGLPPRTVADRLKRFRVRPDFIAPPSHLYRSDRPDVFLAAKG